MGNGVSDIAVGLYIGKGEMHEETTIGKGKNKSAHGREPSATSLWQGAVPADSGYLAEPHGAHSEFQDTEFQGQAYGPAQGQPCVNSWPRRQSALDAADRSQVDGRKNM